MQQNPLLQTKLYTPPVRPELVSRPRLTQRLNAGLHRKLTLISAPAGFGKTTLLSEWVCNCGRPATWLSLDQGDSDSTRFLTYLVAALQAIAANIGEGALGALLSPQPPPTEAILTALLNEITTIPDGFILVLDDYHVIGAKPVDASTSVEVALTFLIEHQPPQMHLVIATRENPQLPLARYRARGQLTELRATDLRFSLAEAAEFLNQAMGLNLSAENIAALETRTEGWIVGLQLAALALQGTSSIQGHPDASSFIKSFTGSHHFVLDYLVEEVLHQQSESVQMFLLRTSILDRMCGPLCDAVRFVHSKSADRSARAATAVLQEDAGLSPSVASGQEILEYLERANLFIVPLDNERRWYRYQHLFGELLRQRLQQQLQQSAATSARDEGRGVDEYHIRASIWYEDNGLALEAFHHAAAANDIARAERLIEGDEIPLHLLGASVAILDWLASLPATVMDARPSLWATWAAMLLVRGHTTGVEEKLQAAEAGIAEAGILDGELDEKTRNLVGQIAAARATLALTQYQVETIFVQVRRALEYLHPDNLPFRATATWTLGVAYALQGDRAAAARAFDEALTISQTSGDTFHMILATVGLAQVLEAENQLHLAAETYRRGLQLVGEQPLPNACEPHLGLARILYQWNDLDAAQQHGQHGLQLARQYENIIDRFVLAEVFLARLKLARGDEAGAAAMLAEAGQAVRRHNFVHRMPEVAAAQVRTLLRQGDTAAAARIAEKHELPRSQARVLLARKDTSTALAILEPLRQQMEAKGWQDELLKVMVLQAVALHERRQEDSALEVVGEALALAEPGGHIRVFVDEGLPMAQLLSEAAARGTMPGYTGKLLAALDADAQERQDESLGLPDSLPPGVQPLIEPLTPREREVLQLIAAGRSNPEIAEELVIAVTTVKTHVRNIYGKLQVSSRFGAAARAQDLNLL